MSESSKKTPYKSLGSQLKSMRVKRQETVAEVSGAVEIDDAFLKDIELGVKRPSEDILMLLISHFSVKDQDAVKLWELAGYTQPVSHGDHGHDGHTHKRPDDVVQPVLVVSMDARVVYTDMASITTNKYGVILNFMQSEGSGGQPMTVSRVGMSETHARKLLKTLEKALNPDSQKLLPAPESKEETDKKQQ